MVDLVKRYLHHRFRQPKNRERVPVERDNDNIVSPTRPQHSHLSDNHESLPIERTNDNIVCLPLCYLSHHPHLPICMQNILKSRLPQTSLTPANSLNILAREILIMILDACPDLATLSAAVHSCSQFHQAYVVAREEILTTITIRELASYKIAIEQPSPAHTNLVRICERPDRIQIRVRHRDDELPENIGDHSHPAWDNGRFVKGLKKATDICYQQRSEGKRSRLSVELCVKLYGCKERGMIQFWGFPGATCVEVENGFYGNMRASGLYCS